VYRRRLRPTKRRCRRASRPASRASRSVSPGVSFWASRRLAVSDPASRRLVFSVSASRRLGRLGKFPASRPDSWLVLARLGFRVSESWPGLGVSPGSRRFPARLGFLVLPLGAGLAESWRGLGTPPGVSPGASGRLGRAVSASGVSHPASARLGVPGGPLLVSPWTRRPSIFWCRYYCQP